MIPSMLMETVVIPLVAFSASLLTFFSGFGLGTLLTPAFALFFPINLAVALAAVVHFLNSLFKLGLVGRHARGWIVIRFGLPAIVAAIAGAFLLGKLSDSSPWWTYRFLDREFQVMPIKVLLGALMLGFAGLEISSRFQQVSFDPRHLPLGGLLSGFFGGLSGNQGALRSAFLVRLGLPKEQFIATGVVIATIIDLTRIAVYSSSFVKDRVADHAGLLALATGAAFLGAFLGNRLLEKVTMGWIQKIVALMLAGIAVALAAGWI